MTSPAAQTRPFPNATPAKVAAFNASVPLYASDDDPMFWPAERLQERRDELLARQLGWLAAGSAHYQKVFAEHGIDVSSITSTRELAKLPITTKADLMADPDSFRLKPPDFGLYDLTYTTVYTTGTTSGLPTKYEYTTHDFFGCLESGRRTMKCTGLRPGDVALTTFPLSPLPHVAGFGPLMNMSAGVAIASAFTGMTYPEFPIHNAASTASGLIETLRPVALYGIGSFLRRMAVDAADEGRDFSSVQMVIASGEVMTSKMLDHLRTNLARCGAVDLHFASAYGCTESGIGWVPGYEGGPLYSTAPDQMLLEVVDPDTHEPLPDGESGLLLLTHLNRRGMPLLRYAMGDLTAITHERCERTGWGGEAILISSGSAHVTRTTDLLKVKGTLLNPQVVHQVVMDTPGVTEYRMVVANSVEGDPVSPDALRIELGLSPGVEQDGWLGDEGESLRRRIQQATEVTPELEVVPMSSIYDPTTEFKARRVVDTRVTE